LLFPLLLLAAAPAPDPDPRNPAAVRIVEVRSLPAPAPFAQPFELRVALRMPPGIAAAVPERLDESEELASTASVVVLAAGTGSGDSVDVRLSYPAIALTDQPLKLPPLLLRLSATTETDPTRRVMPAPAGSVTRGGEADVQLELGMLEVAPHDSAAAFTAVPEPRELAGVLGGRWNGWHLLVIVTLVAGSGLTATLLRRRPLEPSAAEGLDREAALLELDALRERVLLGSGRTRELYRELADIMRRRIQRLHPEWPPGLTGSQIAALLESERPDRRLSDAVERIERARFGRFEPTAEVALEDWSAVRDWVASTGTP